MAKKCSSAPDTRPQSASVVESACLRQFRTFTKAFLPDISFSVPPAGRRRRCSRSTLPHWATKSRWNSLKRISVASTRFSGDLARLFGPGMCKNCDARSLMRSHGPPRAPGEAAIPTSPLGLAQTRAIPQSPSQLNAARRAVSKTPLFGYVSTSGRGRPDPPPRAQP